MAGPRLQVVVASLLVALFGFTVLTTQVSLAQSSQGKNWERAAYDDNNSGFNPQTQINKENVRYLQVKWTYQVPQNPYTGSLSRAVGIKTRPLIIDGTVYIGTVYNRIIALDSENGKEVWSFQPNLTALVANPGAGGSSVDLQHISSYGGLIYTQAADCSIFGLDAKQGTVKFTIPSPCKDIPGGMDYRYAGRGTPVIYEKGGVAIFGQAGQSSGRGFVAGYSTTTSQLLWRWFVVPPRGGDPDWDSKYVVQKGDGSYITGPAKGNIPPYKGDWGTSDKIVGATSWNLNLIDQDTGIFYIGTSVPEGDNLRDFPGPNLFAHSLVALKATTGEMLWYYQLTPHDIYNGNIPFQSGTLAQVQIGGKTVKAVLTASKNGYAYAFDAEKGTLLWEPTKLGVHLNDVHANAGPAADMLITPKDLVGKVICPLGNSNAPPAYGYNTFYVPVQNSCSTPRSTGPNLWTWQRVGPVNSTIYAIDVSTGKTKWQYFMPNPFQGAALAVSGGVVYAVDRVGTFYALDADNGKLLATMNLGGLGAAGVSIGADKKGNMMLLVTSGGSGTDKVTPGTVLALGLGEAREVIKEVTKEVIKEVPKEVIKEVTREVTVETVGPISYAAIGIGIVIAVVGLVLSRRRKA